MCVLLLALVLVTSLPAPAAPSSSLSEAERRRLDGGEIVVFTGLPAGAPADAGQGGTALAIVHAGASAVWQVLTDYRRHSGLYPRVVDSQVLESDGSRSLVRYVVGVGPFSFGFHVHNYPDEANHRLVWRLARDRSNALFKDSWGYWQIEPDSRGVLLTYAMTARVLLPGFLTRGAERDGLVETVKAVRARAEHGS